LSGDPAWHFGFDRWLHSRMVIVRGVEGGFAASLACVAPPP
jgi:hypothetical protein